VGFTPAGGGTVAAAERWPGAKDCRQQERNRAEHVLGEEEERVVWNFQGFQGPLGKERFSTDLGV
jgi:hypothetical protein